MHSTGDISIRHAGECDLSMFDYLENRIVNKTYFITKRHNILD